MVDGKERKTKFTLYDNGEQLLEITEEGKLISRQVNGFETVQVGVEISQNLIEFSMLNFTLSKVFGYRRRRGKKYKAKKVW